ncbi:dnaJ homolog subfamily C member 21 [Pseudomyrmex gracilis]|uniref:dnaJ homolog subfamily C member 21 n=1 Tax=Pseudomyrmex gracilis TaxID=219809 RepID=UPI00099591D1|nr:dnaJ homolog subfamily C member 21 [Pseudomyrmex gracilis]XP_020282826.1 dnaJ homolog subfamily C member 21 [Pseudomyrmex gracilis]XP_020282827.1 dnaJ homolog subfamily C member 21 [Pseudomyrmex gracilis]
MKCHYEVLGVARNAADDEIKKSYRKLALKWHPDKNVDNPDEAKEQFQLVQQAYEILSNPQERAWYDQHREGILKGGLGTDYQDDSLNLAPYFSETCFKGYGDDEKGFYAVYRNVFEKLTAEDAEFAQDGDSDEEIPCFGNSKSSYEDVVHNFYVYWQSYCTKKSYAWLDPYDIRTVPNRRILRMAEKENKKVRDKARRERNEQVRSLVAHVRAKDKRVKAHAKIQAEIAREKRSAALRKLEERKKAHLLERQKLLRNHTESVWSKFSNIEAELTNIEKNLAAEFGTDDKKAIEDDDALYCIACNKVFKTQKAFTNHENSKKHKENVSMMKDLYVDEEKSGEISDESNSTTGSLDNKPNLATDSQMPDFLLNPPSQSNARQSDNEDNEETSPGELVSDDEEISEVSPSTNKMSNGIPGVAVPEMKSFSFPPAKVENEDDDLTSEDELISDQDEEIALTGRQKKKKKKKRNIQNPDLALERDDDEDSISFNEEMWLSKKQRKKLQQKKAAINKQQRSNEETQNEEQQEEADNENETTEDASVANEKVKPEKTKKRSKKEGREKNKSSTADVNNLAHCCVTCSLEFSSKNKLFEHLKKTGHSVYIPEVTKSKKSLERKEKAAKERDSSDKKRR